MPSTPRLETPIWGHLEQVYEPSEDSFLLIDAIEKDLSKLSELNPILVLEIGSGSGVVITALGKWLGPKSVSLAVDINPKACCATRETAKLNCAQIEVVQMDLASCLNRKGLVDVLIFNPPYVITPSEEIKGDIERSWAGGVKGREVTDRLLPCLSELMSEKCVGYIVGVEENIPEEICGFLESSGFHTEVTSRRKILGESLFVIRFFRGINL